MDPSTAGGLAERLWLRMSSGLHPSPEGVTAGGSASGRRLSWLEGWCLSFLSSQPSIGLFERPLRISASFSENKIQEGTAEQEYLLWPSVGSHTRGQAVFYYLPGKPSGCAGEAIQAVHSRRRGHHKLLIHKSQRTHLKRIGLNSSLFWQSIPDHYCYKNSQLGKPNYEFELF